MHFWLVTACHSMSWLLYTFRQNITLCNVIYRDILWKCVTKRYFPWHFVTSQKCIKIKFKRFYLGVTLCHILSHIMFIALFYCSDCHGLSQPKILKCRYKTWYIVTKREKPWQAVTSRDKPWDSSWGAEL